LSQLLGLESQIDVNHPGYRLASIFTNVQSALQQTNIPGIQSLNLLTLEVYRISSAWNNSSPGVYPLPVDVLRGFIANGTLPASYLAKTTFTASQLSLARAGVAHVLASVISRPTALLTVAVRTSSFASQVPVFDVVPGPGQVYLVDNNGVPFGFPEAFSLLPDSQLRVFGYSDVPPLANGARGLEVISVRLIMVPAATDVDTDGNLLPDAWELQFFGELGSDPYGDDDGDLYVNLEELIAGTDPGDGQSHPSGPPQQLKAPVVEIKSLTGQQQLKLSWSWPPALADKVKFGVRVADSVTSPFNEEAITPIAFPDGHMELTLPNPGHGQRFYLIYYLVK